MIVVVPMAGRGSRFADKGVTTPKPLIPVLGKPMVAWALRSLEGVAYSRLIFVALREHEEHFGVAALLKELTKGKAEVMLIDQVTEGQLATVLVAREVINHEEGILVASSDTYIDSAIGRDIQTCPPECRGLISVTNMPGERWSFARVDEHGNVVEVAEKVRISDHASTGLYYFSSGRELVAVGESMIRASEKTRGEYYVIPVYQKLIARGGLVRLSHAKRMWDMGTPEALAEFERHFSR
ncbi:MAG: glycosyltransferase family 2 protein [Anaerolineae bacterium]|nr:glycosyltransferase family 2 protein [Anaerolineae bacterium]